MNGQANQALGRLDGLASILPDPALFIYLYVRKETVFSSQIEGTQSSFSDLMLFESAEAPAVPLKDVQEISNYVAAMNHGLRRLREDFPLSLRLIREIHKILLSKERGSGKHPGEFRETQNWIGGTRPGNAPFVPPPPEKIMECMDLLEKFLHREQEDLLILVKTALVHVPFETIHQSDDVRVEHNSVATNQVGIFAGAQNAKIQSNKISNSLVLVGIDLAGDNNLASHNDVTNSGQAALLVEGNDNKVQSNDITEAPLGILKFSGTVGNTHSGTSFFVILIPVQDPVPALIVNVVPQR